ncbi:hypothetical protein C0993_011209 [Termitomyces sp. T159_Od127]|nr:hypothetical protein C0993_011209 [Termitomyces sp. T159_Od127]
MYCSFLLFPLHPLLTAHVFFVSACTLASINADPVLESVPLTPLFKCKQVIVSSPELPLLLAFASPSVTPSSPIKLSVLDVIDSVVASPVIGMDITPTWAKSTRKIVKTEKALAAKQSKAKKMLPSFTPDAESFLHEPIVLSDEESLPEVLCILWLVASSVIQASANPFSLIDDQACNVDDVAPSDADASSNNVDDAAPSDVDASLNCSEASGSVASFVIQDDVVEYVTSSDESMDQHSVHSVDCSHPDVVEVDDSTDPDEVIDYSSLVMQPDIQDPLLTPTYTDLPFISEPVELIPYGYDWELGDEASPHAHFSAVGSRMCPEDFESLTAAMQFVQYGYYVNLA